MPYFSWYNKSYLHGYADSMRTKDMIIKLLLCKSVFSFDEYW